MGFGDKKKQQRIRESRKTLSGQAPTQKFSEIPDFRAVKTETRKRYNFTLTPSTRDKLNELSKIYGAKSDSALLTEWIEYYYQKENKT